MFHLRKILSFVVIATVLTFNGGSNIWASKVQVEDAKKKVSSLEQEKQKVQSALKDLEGLKNDAAAYVKKLDGNLESLSNELASLTDKITVKETDIKQTQEDLDAAKETESRQYQSMKLRIKYMYEKGDTSYIDMILQVKSMSELLNRTEYISKISEYDRNMLNKYIEIKNQVAEKEKKLQTEHEELLEMQDTTKAKQASVEQLMSEKTKELNNYKTKIASAQDQISEYDKDIKAQENQIKQLEAEMKRKEEAAKKAAEAAGKSYNTVSLGNTKFIWPCPASGRISSGFGSRSSPTEGASSNHQGIDIPASTGSGIVAAASGQVIISTYSYSAGNYIMISHGGGVYTVYMHCSALLVSQGAEVKQGQTIARVGSTGYSTGPHLHFGIRSGGSYVNPSKYVSP